MGRAANTPEVLWSKVDRRGPDECWPWIGFRNEQGYGRTWIKGRGYYAHRVIFDLVNPGAISLAAPKVGSGDTGFLMHSCDNPCCCNPAHLKASTHDANMADKKSKGRAVWNRPSTETPRAKLTLDQVVELKRLKDCRLPRRELAKQFGVSLSTIKGVLSQRHYRDVVV